MVFLFVCLLVGWLLVGRSFWQLFIIIIVVVVAVVAAANSISN